MAPGSPGGGGAGFGPPGAQPRAGQQQQLPRFKLSSATAEPQNDGAAVNFSVEYALEGGQFTTDLKIVWVITAKSGDEIEKPVILRTSGKQRSFNKDVKADRGPFQCYFAIVMSDGKKEPISDTISMK